MLVVEILDVQPFKEQPWGFTGVFHKKNGGGFLDQHYPLAAKAIWDFEGIYASSRHIPGVRFPGLIHPGLMGCAPSHELLEIWNKREEALVEVNFLIYVADRARNTLPKEPTSNLPIYHKLMGHIWVKQVLSWRPNLRKQQLGLFLPGNMVPLYSS